MILHKACPKLMPFSSKFNVYVGGRCLKGIRKLMLWNVKMLGSLSKQRYAVCRSLATWCCVLQKLCKFTTRLLNVSQTKNANWVLRLGRVPAKKQDVDQNALEGSLKVAKMQDSNETIVKISIYLRNSRWLLLVDSSCCYRELIPEEWILSSVFLSNEE